MFEPQRRAITTINNSLRQYATEFEPGLYSGDQAAAIVELVAETERLAAVVKALAAARVDESNRWRRDGHRSAAHWMAAKTGTSIGGARAAIDTAKRVAKLPQVDEAFRSGQLSASQAEEISATAAVAPNAEHDLLAAAKTETLTALRDKCRRTKAAALPNEVERNEAVRRSRYFRHRYSADGAFEASMRLTPLDGARFMTALEPFQTQAFHHARRTGVREPFEAYTADAVVAMSQARNPQPPNQPAPTPATTATSTATQTADPTSDPTSDPTAAVTAASTSAASHPTPTTTAAPTATAAPTGATAATTPTTTATATAAMIPTTTAASTPAASYSDSAATASSAPNPMFEWPADPTSESTSTVPCDEATDIAVTAVPPPAADARPTLAAPPGPPPVPHVPVNEPTPATNTAPPPDAGDRPAAEPPGERPTADPPGEPSGAPSGGPSGAAIPDRPTAVIHVRVDLSAIRRGYTVDGEICEIPGIGPIPVATATMLAADSLINVLLVDGVDVTRVVHTGRTVNAIQRTAIRERTDTCEVPHCDVRDGLEIDHNETWAVTKKTSLDDLNVLCRWHHYQKTHFGARLTGPPGNRTWHPPTSYEP